ncbi:hypothetical protein [Micromonospora sp. NPDC047740]|uniref:hypothetical protein n=1 Tax=Micromonospora sp. NPDC047740 TaxID=3364254 RepID=UPI003722C85E
MVVAGRLYTRDWTDDAGNHRALYELEAVAVGHDLSRGRARFLRNRPSMTTSTVEDAEAEGRVLGEATEPVPVAQTPASLDDRPFDDDFELPEFDAPRGGTACPATRTDRRMTSTNWPTRSTAAPPAPPTTRRTTNWPPSPATARASPPRRANSRGARQPAGAGAAGGRRSLPDRRVMHGAAGAYAGVATPPYD